MRPEASERRTLSVTVPSLLLYGASALSSCGTEPADTSEAGEAQAASAAAPEAAGGAPGETSPETASETTPAPESTDAPATSDSAVRERCSPPTGVSNAPRSVADAVSLVNAMTKPVSVPCFVDVLARPLEFHATRSVFSAQPATGDRTPRIFLFYDPLIMSIVPDGVGSHLVEFGELRDDMRSLKAEIEFPVETDLEGNEPFDRIMFNDTLTGCAFCHADERQADDVTLTRGFVSQALRPQTHDRVSATRMMQEYLICDFDAEPERCAMLDALFGAGEVEERDFPEAMDTFF